MFHKCSSLRYLDLSNFDTSKVQSMNGMFYNCKNLTKLNFGNIDTSFVSDMSWMFNGCSSLKTIDLSKFDTSKVTTMSYMFCECTNLIYLDLSNFQTSKVNTIKSMFRDCNSLIYLNLKSFTKSFSLDYDNAFDGTQNPKICIKETFLFIYYESICHDKCFDDKKKIDLTNKKCVDSCKDNEYEYNTICYKECPEDTYIFLNNNNPLKNTKQCLDETPQGYYLNIDKRMYEACYENCKLCYGKGNPTKHNCKECIQRYTFLNDSIYYTNCYIKCTHYYFFSDSNEYKCAEKCEGKYNKLII